MKILILAESIGTNDVVDEKIVGIVREFSDDSEIHTYSRKFVLGDAGEYIRIKRVAIHTLESTLVANMQNEYDALVAFDDWAIKASAPFVSEKKIRVTDNASVISLIKEINGKQIKPPKK